VRWHLVGHLQSNKARHAVGAFDLIHSVDGTPLAAEMDRRAAAAGLVQPVLVHVNLAREATKSGVSGEEAIDLIRSVRGLPHLDVKGLMTIPPPVEDAERSRPWFARLRALREEARDRLGADLPELSMGMSDDFEVAIEEGATIVRVGTAIFGERSP
jgi:pyridoxal phosphate enzyme (YggS family)